MSTKERGHGLVLRPADPTELAALEPLYDTWANAVFEPVSNAGLMAALPSQLRHPLRALSPDAPRHRCVIAETDNRIVGVAATLSVAETINANGVHSADDILSRMLRMTPGRSLHICALAVLPQYRRRGIARRLIAVAEAEAQALRLPKLSVSLFQHAQTGCRFLEASGFERTAHNSPPDGAWQVLGEFQLLEKSVPGHQNAAESKT